MFDTFIAFHQLQHNYCSLREAELFKPLVVASGVAFIVQALRMKITFTSTNIHDAQKNEQTNCTASIAATNITGKIAI